MEPLGASEPTAKGPTSGGLGIDWLPHPCSDSETSTWFDLPSSFSSSEMLLSRLAAAPSTSLNPIRFFCIASEGNRKETLEAVLPVELGFEHTEGLRTRVNGTAGSCDSRTPGPIRLSSLLGVVPPRGLERPDGTSRESLCGRRGTSFAPCIFCCRSTRERRRSSSSCCCSDAASLDHAEANCARSSVGSSISAMVMATSLAWLSVAPAASAREPAVCDR